jgi:hypothetical protein
MELLQARDAIARQLREDGFAIGVEVIGDEEARVARRSELLSSARMHTFVVLFTTPRLSGDETERLANKAQHYAISHKGGLPRGLQTGTATLVVFLAEDVSDDAVAWVDRSPVHRFAALRFAVLVDLKRYEIAYWDGRWLRGWVFRDRILSTVQSQIIRPLDRLAPEGAALERRRAPGTEQEKLSDALGAHRAATKRGTPRRLGVTSEFWVGPRC